MQSLACLGGELVLEAADSKDPWRFLSKGTRVSISTLGRIAQYPQEDRVKQEAWS